MGRPFFVARGVAGKYGRRAVMAASFLLAASKAVGGGGPLRERFTPLCAVRPRMVRGAGRMDPVLRVARGVARESGVARGTAPSLRAAAMAGWGMVVGLAGPSPRQFRSAPSAGGVWGMRRRPRHMLVLAVMWTSGGHAPRGKIAGPSARNVRRRSPAGRRRVAPCHFAARAARVTERWASAGHVLDRARRGEHGDRLHYVE